MAPKIILKKSTVAAKVPLVADLEQGELAVNLTDQKIYSKNGSGTIVVVGEVNDGGGGGGGGATGGGTDKVFYENDQTVTTDYTITDGQNAMSAGPITINSGVTVTVGAGEVWTVV